MSIIYCERHNIQWDSDFKDMCPICDGEPSESESIQRFDPLSDMSRQSLGHYVRYSEYLEALAHAEARAAKLEAALREIEVHHAENNRKAGRDESRSKTLQIVRAVLKEHP